LALGVVVVAVVTGAGVWAVMRALEAPAVEAPRFTRDDGVRAQQKIADLARHRPKTNPVVLSEAEVNAFVSRHLDPEVLPVRDAVIRLRDGDVVEIVGTVALGRLLRESPVGTLGDMLPAGWLARRIWLTIDAQPATATEPRRTLRLDARRLTVGRQPVPALLLRLVLEPASLRLMHIGLPSEVQTVRIDRGRVVIQTTSPPSRT